LARTGVTTLALVWDNVVWHAGRAIRPWLGEHHRRVHRAGGVRSIPCWLPTKRPWRNPIAPKWVHAKRRVVEPARLLTAHAIERRVSAAFGCPASDHLMIPQEVACSCISCSL
jgi:hypothetical protein